MLPIFGLLPPSSPFEPQPLLPTSLASPVQALLYFAHHVLQIIRRPAKSPKPSIRVICIADTHTLIPTSIPEGDVLIHAGDLTNEGTPSDLHAQLTWIASLPHQHKIVIAGNHDTQLDPRSRATLHETDRSAPLPDWPSFGIHYLQHSTVTLHIFPSRRNLQAKEVTHKHSLHDPLPNVYHDSDALPRTLRIHGAPQIPACGPSSFAFQHSRERDAWTDTIPPDTDILVTHTPPAHHRDNFPQALGDRFLLRELWRVRPRLHVCGHVHEGAGREILWWDQAQRAYEDGCTRRTSWLTRGLLDIGLWMVVARVVVWGLIGLVWNRVWGGEERGTVLVNAALIKETTRRLENKIQVVDI